GLQIVVAIGVNVALEEQIGAQGIQVGVEVRPGIVEFHVASGTRAEELQVARNLDVVFPRIAVEVAVNVRATANQVGQRRVLERIDGAAVQVELLGDAVPSVRVVNHRDLQAQAVVDDVKGDVQLSVVAEADVVQGRVDGLQGLGRLGHRA